MDDDTSIPFVIPYMFRIYLQNDDLDYTDKKKRIFLTDWNNINKGTTPRTIQVIKDNYKGVRLLISSKVKEQLQKKKTIKAQKYTRFYNSFKLHFCSIKNPTEKVFGTHAELNANKKVQKKRFLFNFLETCDNAWVVLDYLYDKMIELDFNLPSTLNKESMDIVRKWYSDNIPKDVGFENDLCKKLLNGLLLLTLVDKKNMICHMELEKSFSKHNKIGSDESTNLTAALPKEKIRLGISSLFHALDNYSFGIEIEKQVHQGRVNEQRICNDISNKLSAFKKYKEGHDAKSKLCFTTKELSIPSKFSKSYKAENIPTPIKISCNNIHEEADEIVYDTKVHNAKKVVAYVSFDNLVPIFSSDEELKENMCLLDGNRTLQIAMLLKLDTAFVNGLECGPKIEDVVIYNTMIVEEGKPIFLPCKKLSIFPTTENSAFKKDPISDTYSPDFELCPTDCHHEGLSKIIALDNQKFGLKRKMFNDDNESEEKSEEEVCVKKTKAIL